MEEKTMIDEINEPEVDYVEAINQLKANSVNKTEYDKLKAENQKLLKSIINGETIDPESIPAAPDINELRKSLYGGEGFEGTNVEFVQKVMDLRNAVVEKYGEEADPFLPHGREYTLTPQDYVTAEKVANNLQECLDIANGDSHLFTMELQRRMAPSPMDRVKK